MSIATAQPRKLREAYTLVELLVVMAALTILAAVLLPSIKGLLHDQKVSAASRMVKAHFEAAQARAIGGSSPVAVILERGNAELPNMVTRLSIGQVFPPYEGDMSSTTGILGVSTAGLNFYDTLTVSVGEAGLLSNAVGVFTRGDYLQLDDRQTVYQVLNVDNGLITFINPPAGQEPDLQISSRMTDRARFRLYRKPTKSFLQTLTLPRGTCVDLSVSGFGPAGNQFATTVTGQAMLVFNPQGRIAYWNNGVDGPMAATSLIHVMIGRTEQVGLSLSDADLMQVANPDEASTFNTNVNDTNNTWLTVNPFTGAISSSGVQAGNEASGTLAARLPVARAFATYGITQSEN